ncbi:SMP-30/gluconolactonase/LRE family protein [Neolewinella antarctica]|uniref:Gluconolactonase n=1 Tax=Neolewinella antarctica TaxID=442734 RepID=A0ABX0X897_9BACT|nr:SMP-30/gluconolactonase/LRE family protein [Neolewinella antarctica]NJC25463.1 gluconolactonase [Neolewinella antarctica]
MQKPHFFVADAHEGPVWVADQCRLYYTTKTHLDGRRRVDIEFLDFSHFDLCDEDELWKGLPEDAAMQISPRLFHHDAGMANGMCLSQKGRDLLVAEQGDKSRPSLISSVNVADHTRKVLVDNFEGHEFNSLNKVILTKAGHLVFSDPDYGFRQDFRPAPQLEPAIYVRTADGTMTSFRCALEMPHGLALSPDERTLFITDTSNDGAHGDDIELGRRKSVWKFDFDPKTGKISGEGACCFQVAKGVPDGAVTTEDRLLVGGGDAVYVADLEGKLIGKIPTPNNAVNVALAGGGKHLFVTIDVGILLFIDWRSFVRDV